MSKANEKIKKIDIGLGMRLAWNIFSLSLPEIILVVLIFYALGHFLSEQIVISWYQEVSDVSEYLLYFLILFFFEIIGTGILICLTFSRLRKRSYGFMTLCQYVLENLPQLIVVSALAGLILMLGFMLLIIPGIIAMVYLLFINQAVLIDDKKYFDAIVFSKDQVRGYFFEFLLVMLIGITLTLAWDISLHSLIPQVDENLFLTIMLQCLVSLVPAFMTLLYTVFYIQIAIKSGEKS